MSTPRTRRPINPGHIHQACGAAALLCCVPLLFPHWLPKGWDFLNPYLGAGIMAAAALSLLVMAVAVAAQLARLQNLRALWQASSWAGVWCCAAGIFVLLALAADVPPPAVPQKLEPIQATDTLHKPNESLLGPAGLAYPITTDGMPEDRLVTTPNLTALEDGHTAILNEYIDRSPRWRPNENNDTFHSKAGHLVLVPPTAAGAPGLVHASFRRLVGGTKLPEGYTVCKPGDPLPQDVLEGKAQMPDLALDLGRDHYLLLAWRGAPHAGTAAKALNAAITAVDERMAPLAAAPTHETLLRMLGENAAIPGSAPEMRVCSPPAQEGCYQAEFYVNPHEPGTLQIFFRRMADNATLRTFTMPARYSDKADELFRHDLPGSLREWERTGNKLNNLFPRNTPLFVLWEDKGNEFAGVAVELWFAPDDTDHPRRLLLRRCYNMQPYSAKQEADITVPVQEDQAKQQPRLPDLRRLLPRIMS